MTVKVECTALGWFFEARGSRLGPFTLKEMDSPDFETRLSSELKVEPKEVLAAKLSEEERSIDSFELAEILSTTVKRDEPSKMITFLGMLLAQTDEDQYNVAFQAESSAGKSYIPLELIEYFPEEERRVYAGASPTSFFHEIGEWDKERRVMRVDLERKILVFLDQPHWMLLEKLRPLLSHDRKVLTYKITDKREKAGLRTKTVELIGFPTVVFCTTKPTLEDQERTRLWLLSPETSQEKIRDALGLIAWKEGDRERFKTWVEEHPMRQWLKARVAGIRGKGVRNVEIPDEEGVLNRFLARKTHLTPRDQRDFPRLLRLIKALALLNCYHREDAGPYTVKANVDDIEEGFRLYETLARSNEIGLSPEVYEVYEKVIKPLVSNENGASRKDIRKRYWEVFHRPFQDDRLRRDLLPSLESAGLITQEPDPNDKRQILVYPTVPSPISGEVKTENEINVNGKYRGENSGVGSQLHKRRTVSTSTDEEITEPSRIDEPKLSLGELIPKLGETLSEGRQDEYIDLIERLGGYSREEAGRIFKDELEGKLLFMNPEGRWKWLR